VGNLKNPDFKNPGFSRSEILGIGIILFLIVFLSVFNFKYSQIKARDAQRKDDLKSIFNAVYKFQKDFSFYPPALDGRILNCGDPRNLQPCAWGVDKLTDRGLFGGEVYLSLLPKDPLSDEGYSYLYFSDGKNAQILAHLEDAKDSEVSKEVIKRGLACGLRICNYEVSSVDRN